MGDPPGEIDAGDVVLTPYGVATVLSCPPPPADDESSSTSSHARCGCLPPVPTPDDADDPHQLFLCSLWRRPGLSVASGITATLPKSCIARALPAAPGMFVELESSRNNDASSSKAKSSNAKFLVLCYCASNDTYLVTEDAPDQSSSGFTTTEGEVSTSQLYNTVSVTNNSNTCMTIQSVPSSSVLPSKAAKIYPLLYALMKRGDDASQTTRDFFDSSPVKELTIRLEEKANTVVSTAQSKKEEYVSRYIESGDLEKKTAELQDKVVQTATPDSQEVRAIYDMLRDEELTVLLQKAQTKLRQLVDTDLPRATESALRQAGIEVDLTTPISGTLDGPSGDEETTYGLSMVENSRAKALGALDALLMQQGTDGGIANVEDLKYSMTEQFGTMFDTLAEVAGSDHTLSSIFDKVHEKTSEWQAISGRLMSTRSVNVFMEGTSRLRKRAQAMFFSEGGTGGLELTKAFTEGDVAVARLKSLELGDAVRSRLLSAIEMRSESEGGLDGIIAGALKSMTGDPDFGKDAQVALRSKISGLQDTANIDVKDAKESLISMLSSESLYRDLALLRIEESLVELESHLDMSAEALASLASGEGGTSSIFEPLAQKAAKEIEKQLDTVEESVSDETAVAILLHVRRIVSGDMSINALVDEVTSLLNDETIVSAGEELVKKGELVLDAFEGKSGNKTIDDVVAAAERAGITKSVVMRKMQSIDVNTVLDTASSAATDDEARLQLISTATDSALDFLLNILPSMPVPPFDGVKDGVVYHLSNLSLEGFKVKKEDIYVSIAGIRASESSPSEEGMSTSTKAERAHELLTIDVKNISAELDNACWSFEQTYLPYLKGGGMADSRMWQGCIKLQFELRKQRKNASSEDGNVEWEPKLCLCERFVSIGEVELKLQGDGKLTWILNKLADLFKSALRDYCVTVIGNAITKRSGWLLESLNSVLSPYWPVILRTAALDFNDLPQITATDVTDSVPDPTDLIYDLVFRDQVPLGINLLLNDESGFVRVVDFPRGSQSRKIAQEKGLDPDMFKSGTIVSVNGSASQKHCQADVMALLKDPGRPKTIQLRISDDVAEAERVRRLAATAKSKISSVSKATSIEDTLGLAVELPTIVSIDISDDGPIGIKFVKSIDDVGLAIGAIDPANVQGASLRGAVQSKDIQALDVLSHVNDVVVLGQGGVGRRRALEELQKCGGERPLLLKFVKPCSHLISFQTSCADGLGVGGADEFVLGERKITSGTKQVFIQEFQQIAGVAEKSGIFIGDHLISVGGFPVGAGCLKYGDAIPEFHHVMQILQNENPLALVFARPRREDRWNVKGTDISTIIDGAETIKVLADDFEELGCSFSRGKISGTVVVSSFSAVQGCIRRTMEKQLGKNILGLSIEMVAGQVVPSYASPEIVKNAIARNWPTDVVFCNIAQQSFLSSLI